MFAPLGTVHALSRLESHAYMHPPFYPPPLELPHLETSFLTTSHDDSSFLFLLSNRNRNQSKSKLANTSKAKKLSKLTKAISMYDHSPGTGSWVQVFGDQMQEQEQDGSGKAPR